MTKLSKCSLDKVIGQCLGLHSNIENGLNFHINTHRSAQVKHSHELQYLVATIGSTGFVKQDN